MSLILMLTECLNKITIEEATISELKLALAGKDGRSWFPGYFINDLEY